MKTRKQLFKDAQSGKLRLKLIERYGEKVNKSTPRPVIRTNTNSLFLTQEGYPNKESELSLPKASLIAYDDTNLKVYAPGLRELNKEEKEILDEWKQIEESNEYKRNVKTDLLTDTNFAYYQKRQFFASKKKLYLGGFSENAELKPTLYFSGDDLYVLDPKVKGNLILHYEVSWKEEK